MRLVVTTSYSVLSVDLTTGQIAPLHRGNGLYYGVAWNNDTIMVGARGRMVSSEQPLDGEQGAILVFDKQFSFLSKLQPSEFRLRDIHEITWNDDCLWVTCSYDNMIAIWNGSRWEKWYPLGATIRELSDQNHFNSLFFEDNSFWIIAHNNGPSELLQFKRGSRQLRSRISLGNQAHNLWRENGSLYTCSSGESAIVGTDGFRLETGGFPRGVAFGHGMRCIGISELAERRFRDLTTARIAIFDDKWNRLSDIELPNEGLILDIKLQSELSN